MFTYDAQKKDFPTVYQDFNVVHNYLISNTDKIQARIRKRGQASKLLKKVFFLREELFLLYF